MRKKRFSASYWLLFSFMFIITVIAVTSTRENNIKNHQFQESVRRTKLNIILAEEMEVGDSGWIEGKVVYNNKASQLCWLERKAEVLPEEDKDHPFRLTRQKDAYEIIHPEGTDDFLYWTRSYAPRYIPPSSDYFPLRVTWGNGKTYEPYEPKDKEEN